METVEVNPKELEFDEAIEGILGVANINDYEDLPESYKEDGLVATVPAFRVVDGIKKCFAGRKYVQYAQLAGIPIIFAQRYDVPDSKVIELAIKSNTTKHGSELIRAKMVQHLYETHSTGQGARSDRKESEEDLLMTGESDLEGKKKRRPTTYDKIGPMIGVSPKKAMMLRMILLRNPGYFDRMERERTSVYEAYSKCKDEAEGYTPAPPTEKPAVNTTDSTGVPKFSAGSPTYDVNTVYQFVEGTSVVDSTNEGKKKMVAALKVVYTTQKFVCPHCGEEIEIVVPKTVADETATK